MFDEHRGAVDQDVEIVDRGEAIFRVGRNMDGNFSVRTDIVDRLQALALGQGKEWAFHRFALVAKRQCRQLRQKEVYLTVFAVVMWPLMSCNKIGRASCRERVCQEV